MTVSSKSPPSVRLLIADDEPAVREELRAILAQHDRISIVAACSDGNSALDAIREHRPDGVLLDVQMPGMTGVEVLAAMRDEERPPTIFITAYDVFAVRAFELNAIDYVLKPFDDRRVLAAVQRLIDRRDVNSRANAGAIDRTIQTMLETAAPARPDRLVVHHGNRLRVIPTRDVEWIEASDNYVQIHARGEASLLRITMGAFQSQLDSRQFMRVHRSFIVNLDRILELRLQPTGDYEILLAGGASVPLGRTYRDQLITWLQR
jgi:two-component system LytT family response regulator